MKRFLGLLISAFMMIQMLSLPVSAKEENPESFKTMQAFGVISKGTRADSVFTTADMSVMLYRLFNLHDNDVPEASRQIYTDVDRWHSEAGYIEWLYNNGVYTGNGEGAFEPDREVRLSDACLVMLNLLGYKKVMDLAADDDYIKKAGEIGLLSGIDHGEHDITYGEFASICYELLFTKVIEGTFGSAGKFMRGGEFIQEILGLSYDKGIVTGADGFSLTRDICGENEVIIDGMRYSADGVAYGDHLGYCVKYYYDPKSDTLAAAVPVKNEVLEIKSKDIISYMNNCYTYKSGGQRKRVYTNTPVMLLYNGKITTEREAFKPVYGKVRLIDNDRDGKFDCVIAENAVNIIFDKAAGGIIFGKNKKDTDKLYILDTKKFDKFILRNSSGEDMEIGELKENDVLTTVISEDGKYAAVYVSRRSVQGILSFYNEPETIEVDETEYDLASAPYNPLAIKSAGNDVNILLDVYGNVAAVLGNIENKYVFGYIISTKKNEEEDTLVLKILTENSEIRKIVCSEKLMIDENRATDPDSAEALIRSGELIKYRVVDGEIRYIDTAVRKSGFEDMALLSDKNSLRMIADGRMQYKSGAGIFKSYTTGMTMYAEFGVNTDTPIFFVPTADEYIDDRNYYVANSGYIISDYQAEVQAYTAGSSTITADAVVIHYKTGLVNASKLAVIDKVVSTLDEYGDVIYKLHGMSSGKEIEMNVPDAASISNIGKGSVIRYQLNKDNAVRALQNLYGVNGTGDLNTNASHTYSNTSGMDAHIRVMLGYVESKDGTLVRFKFKDGVAPDEVFNLRNCNFYVYDAEEKPQLREGNIDDLYDRVRFGSGCDDVIIATRAALASDVIIIKK